MTTTPSEILAAVLPVTATLERLQILYEVGGSFASSAHGISRATNDLDLVARFPPHLVTPFVTALQHEYYLSESAIRSAIVQHSCFNVLHLDTGFKVDVFCVRPGSFEDESLTRARPFVLTGSSVELPLISAEDIVLKKLEWFRLGGEQSERQWNDLLGVLKVQGHRLDRQHREREASRLGVADLLAKAVAESQV